MLTLQPGRPPVLADRFEILGTVDHSGSTWTYLAWDVEEERWVTVRMPSFRASRDPMSRTRFEREIGCLQKLKHPNLLPVYAAEPQHPVHPWAATGVAECGSVADWIKDHGPMPPFLAIDVMAHVCSGLAAAHRTGVSHGGLKLEHVLIDARGSCMLSGLRGGGDRTELQDDLKSAGALLFSMITGKPWEDGISNSQLGSLPRAISRAIEQTRKGRGGYADVSTFSRDLEAAVLELEMPEGQVPPLAAPDSGLPEDPAAVFDELVEFVQLQHFAALALDPEYTPEDDGDPPTPVSDELGIPSPSEGPKSVDWGSGMSVDPASQRKAAPAPYQMSTASSAADAFSEDNYKIGEKPLYEDEAKSTDEWKQWDPSEDMVVKEPEPDAKDQPMVTEATLIRLVAMAALFLVTAAVGSVFWGSTKVGEARAEAEQAATTLVEAVRRDSQLVYALANEGGDRKALETAYFAYSEARNEVSRVKAAQQFVALVNAEAEAAGLGPDATTKLVDRIDALDRASSGLDAKRTVWAQRASGFPGVLAVTLGIQIAPPY